MIESAPPFDFRTSWFIVAAVLALIALQPPFALLMFRDMRRAWRGHRLSILRGTGGASRRVTTFDAGVLLSVLFLSAAIVLRPSIPIVLLGAITLVLIVLGLLDYRYFWLPDRLTLPFGLVGLAAAWPDSDLLAEGAIAAVLAGLAFYAIHAGYRYLRGFDGLGLGDVKMVSALGAWVGVAALPWLVLAACTSALLVAASTALAQRAGGKTDDGSSTLSGQVRSPFGLHLAIAGWIFICLRHSPYAGS